MSKSSLISCISCGSQVSYRSSRCPKCGRKNFKDVECYVCGERMKSHRLSAKNGYLSKVYHGHGNDLEYDTKYNFFHIECVKKKFVPEDSELEKFSQCIDCGVHNLNVKVSLMPLTRMSIRASCPECGGGNSAVQKKWNCYFCGLPVFPEVQSWDHAYKKKTNQNREVNFHNFCREKYKGVNLYISEEERERKQNRRILKWVIIIVLSILFTRWIFG